MSVNDNYNPKQELANWNKLLKKIDSKNPIEDMNELRAMIQLIRISKKKPKRIANTLARRFS